MKNRLAAAAVAGALALGGCATTSTTTPTADIVTTIQNDAVAACQFLPTAATVTAIISTVVPGVTADATLASQLASQICAAVSSLAPGTPAAARRRSAMPPTVNGVAIHGRFVK